MTGLGYPNQHWAGQSGVIGVMTGCFSSPPQPTGPTPEELERQGLIRRKERWAKQALKYLKYGPPSEEWLEEFLRDGADLGLDNDG